jgi:hypothetical protein
MMGKSMKSHQMSPFSGVASSKQILTALLTIGSIGATRLQAQTIQAVNGLNSGIQVAVDWHTVAEPKYGASYQYAWNDIHLHTQDGGEVSTDLGFEISKNEGGGLFTMLSKPISVTSSGMTLLFDRVINMQPSSAEQGTSLPNDLKDKCQYHTLGVTRAVFHQVIDIVDAESGQVLAYHVDEYKFDISRRQVLNSTNDNKKVTIDLTPFVDHKVKIRVWILAGYNGRGPAKSTTPHIAALNPTTHQDLK